MAKRPTTKKRSTPRRIGNRRQHLIANLVKLVNKRSPVKVKRPKELAKQAGDTQAKPNAKPKATAKPAKKTTRSKNS